MSSDDLDYIIAPKDNWYCAGRMGKTVSEVIQNNLIIMRTDADHVRILYNHPSYGVVAGVHYKPFEDIHLVVGMHTRPVYRRKGMMTKLLELASEIDGILTIDGNRTHDGDKLVQGLRSQETSLKVLIVEHVIY